MKNKKGFTLIELLAVIIILAVIALIATPIVLNVIDNARKSANKDSAYGLLDSTKLYYMESLLDESKSLSGNLIDKINVSGRKPDSGEVYVNNKGEIALAVVYDKTCYIKNYSETDLTESKDIDNCTISGTVEMVLYELKGKMSIENSNINPTIVVFSDTPHYATLDENGSFEVKDLEKGNHEFYLLNEALETVKSMSKEEIQTSSLISFNFNTSEAIENNTWTLSDGSNIKLDNCVISKTSDGLYKDSILNGADPVLKDNLIPVVINNDGTVKKADLSKEWYNYTNKTWANAVTLKDKSISYNDEEIIPGSNIDGYFVWIPRYKYQIFNEGNYNYQITVEPSESVSQEIQIVFESKTVTPSQGSKVGEYLTHPAFTTLDVNGIWVGKFETSGSTTDIDVLPNATSLRNINVKTMFELAYSYDRSLDSHMMKNTEWGAVAYLSHSKYGINEEIRINNSSTYTTGCAATVAALNYTHKLETDHTEGYYNGCENTYNTPVGVLASTTGNISGIYDMSGGSWEDMASYMDGIYGKSGFDAKSIAIYDNKYFDIYSADSTETNYNKRILGDATGELGPFYFYKNYDDIYQWCRSTWGGDQAHFVGKSYYDYSWFVRGGLYDEGVVAGSFAFNSHTGGAYSDMSFRLGLAD